MFVCMYNYSNLIYDVSMYLCMYVCMYIWVCMYVCMLLTVHASNEPLQRSPFSAIECMHLVVDGPVEMLEALIHTYIHTYIHTVYIHTYIHFNNVWVIKILTPGKTLKLELSNTSKMPVSPLGFVRAVYIHTCIHTCIHTYIHTYIHLTYIQYT